MKEIVEKPANAGLLVSAFARPPGGRGYSLGDAQWTRRQPEARYGAVVAGFVGAILSLSFLKGGTRKQASAAGLTGFLSYPYRADVAERSRRAAIAALTETKRRQKAVEEIENDAKGKLEQAGCCYR